MEFLVVLYAFQQDLLQGKVGFDSLIKKKKTQTFINHIYLYSFKNILKHIHFFIIQIINS